MQPLFHFPGIPGALGALQQPHPSLPGQFQPQTLHLLLDHPPTGLGFPGECLDGFLPAGAGIPCRKAPQELSVAEPRSGARRCAQGAAVPRSERGLWAYGNPFTAGKNEITQDHKPVNLEPYPDCNQAIGFHLLPLQRCCEGAELCRGGSGGHPKAAVLRRGLRCHGWGCPSSPHPAVAAPALVPLLSGSPWALQPPGRAALMSRQPNGQSPHSRLPQPRFPGAEEMFVPRPALPVSGKRCCSSLSSLEDGKGRMLCNLVVCTLNIFHLPLIFVFVCLFLLLEMG